MATNALKSVDLIGADGDPALGLVPVGQPLATKRALNVDEYAAIVDAATFNRVDYIFFRRFSDGRSSQVAAYVVDNEDGRLDALAVANLHRPGALTPTGRSL